MAKAGKYLAGFSASVNESYPDFYLKFYDRGAEPLPPQVANDWLAKQQDFSKETAAIPLLMTRKLNPELQQTLLENYSMFRERFGQELVLGKAADLLHAQMSKAVGNAANEVAFREFLQKQAPRFPAEDWQIIRFTTGYQYYGAVAKDTLALLRFVNEQPLVHANYMGALYNNMLVRKQLNAEAQILFCQWAQKAVNENSALDAMSSAASWCQRNGDTEGYKRFMQMALNKAKACGMEASRYEKSLAVN
jgi:hypothetical protein